jgi:hypothetical protein
VPSQTCTVTQEPMPDLTISPTTQSVPYTSGSFSISVTSNIDWSVNDDAAWINCSPINGSNNGSINVSYGANTSSSTRTGTITVSGNGVPSQTCTVTQEPSTSNSDPNIIPAATSISANYPNPFNPMTTIEYSVKNSGSVVMKVCNSKGAHIKTLVNAFKSPGFYQVVWDGIDHSGNEVSSGVYFIVLRDDSVLTSRKIMLMK